jgi:predicted DNA-binding WGR domain protein
MNKRIILARTSDVGPMGRGQAGKQKVYEILVTENTVTFSWGMAEKVQRQTKRVTCRSHQHALSEAYAKVTAKQERGYRVLLNA